ncbi:MAG: imidazole glycerol phosphate synthase subunit HisH [Bacteroidales bacterium]|nr:MAG: imidazole glycerol phosphate synthase subunit HisH [Paludibacter sp.]MCE1155437.1 imidazole glycerol phosphate synthase subunit HisH [Bacteroidales bacterium]
MITIIDYGLGNIKAFVNVYTRLNIAVEVARTEEQVLAASKLILPGVGSFDYAITLLANSGLREAIEKKVVQDSTPVIGICVGMQMMAESSDEGVLPGLGWIKGKVKLFDESKISFKTKLPHMGWNNIVPVSENALLSGLDSESRFYFLHSYYFECADESNVLATTQYGVKYACAVNSGNVYGVQFHPEKSHSNGVRLLENFSKL